MRRNQFILGLVITAAFLCLAPLITFFAISLKGIPSFAQSHGWVVLSWVYSVAGIPALWAGLLFSTVTIVVIRRTDYFHHPYDFGRSFSFGAILGALAEACATWLYRAVFHRGFSDFWVAGAMIAGCLAGALVAPIVFAWIKPGASVTPPSATNNESQVRALYQDLLRSWDKRDARGYAALFATGGHLVGFDGSSVNGRSEIAAHLSEIFAHHQTPTYVSIVKSVHFLSPDVAVLSAVAGLVPQGQSDLDPQINAVQTLVAAHVDDRWRIAVFQNTPAAFQGRPEISEKLTEELRGVLRAVSH